MLFFINLLLTVCCDYANLIVLIVMHNPPTALIVFLLSFFFCKYAKRFLLGQLQLFSVVS